MYADDLEDRRHSDGRNASVKSTISSSMFVFNGVAEYRTWHHPTWHQRPLAQALGVGSRNCACPPRDAHRHCAGTVPRVKRKLWSYANGNAIGNLRQTRIPAQNSRETSPNFSRRHRLVESVAENIAWMDRHNRLYRTAMPMIWRRQFR